jgi:hypothetical protein
MTERVWGVIGPERVFEIAPADIKADAWARYGGTEMMPIKGEVAYKENGVVYTRDGTPVTLVEESADPS